MQQIKGGTHDSGVDTRLLRQALQWQCHCAGVNRDGLDLSESEEEGSEKDRERETELHCGGGKTVGVQLRILWKPRLAWERVQK